MKNEGYVERLRTELTRRHFVNLFGQERKIKIKSYLAGLSEGYEQTFRAVIDAGKFRRCHGEEEEARVFLKLLRHAGCDSNWLEGLDECFSIANAMDRLNERLEESALIVFHYFEDKYDEQEKDILRSIRKYISLNEGSFLEILIISSEPVDRWELFPESNLDDRFVTFIDHDQD